MLMKMFTVYDCKAEAHLPPFYCNAAAVALRNFSAAADDSSHAFHRNAADYTLFEIGIFDDETAGIKMHEAKVNLGTALEAMTSEPMTKLRGIQGGE